MAQRTLAFKLVRFKVGRQQGFVPPNMDVLLENLLAAATTVGDRHRPAPGMAISVGTSCFYINRGHRRSPRDGYMIECVSYIHGIAPEQTTQNFSAPSLTIGSAPIVDPATGQARQVVHSYRALFLGQSAIIEAEKGGGGTATLAWLLTSLIRAHVNPAMPSIEFVDVLGANLRRSIAAAGGVARISAALASPATNRRKPLAYRLGQLRDWAGNRGVVRAEIDFPDGQNANKGMEALEEYGSESGLDSVTVHLRDGQKITRLGKFVEKRKVTVSVNPSGNYNVVDIEDAMRNYLTELRRPDNEQWRIIDNDGRPVGVQVVSSSGD